MAENRKKRVLFLTDYAGIYTGFGRQIRSLLSYLYKTGKYELINVAGGMSAQNPDFERFPWKTVGVIPNDPNFVQRMQQDQGFAKNAAYGAETISALVNEHKPDVIFSIQDSWGALHVTDKAFFKKIPTVCWITFDSIPLLPDTIEKASKIKHYWSWNEFARDEFHRLGFKHVKTQFPLINTDHYFQLEESKKQEIRKTQNIPQDCYIFGMCARNQVRKLFNTLIEGYATFLKHNPEMESKSYIHLHTSLGEGWDIDRLCDQYKVNKKRVLCTYTCRESGEYFILPIAGNETKNPKTGRQSLITVNVQNGISEQHLNEIYNIWDANIHVATSGATEMPCIESSLSGKIVATCNYSFGEDIIKNNKGSIAIEHSFYAEHGTQFLKAQPSPFSISKVMNKIITMKPEKRKQMEKDSREWSLTYYSIPTNGKQIEDFIDEHPLIEDEKAWDIHDDQKFNKDAPVKDIADNKDFIQHLYNDILDMKIDHNYDGLVNWATQLENGVPRQNIIDYFRNVAAQEIQKRTPTNFDHIFGVKGEKKKLILVQPESHGDILGITSLFKSIRERYNREEWEFTVSTKPQYRDIIDGNEYVDKWVPYMPQMDNIFWLEGQGEHKGWYDVAYLPYLSTQRQIDYPHNGKDIHGLIINSST